LRWVSSSEYVLTSIVDISNHPFGFKYWKACWNNLSWSRIAPSSSRPWMKSNGWLYDHGCSKSSISKRQFGGTLKARLESYGDVRTRAMNTHHDGWMGLKSIPASN
jgi:hypothetical protein